MVGSGNCASAACARLAALEGVIFGVKGVCLSQATDKIDHWHPREFEG